MCSGSSLTSTLYDKIIKMPSKSHETIPLMEALTFNEAAPAPAPTFAFCFSFCFYSAM
jgi:hypothetical protein